MPTLADYRLTLANFNGEETVEVTASRDNFINIAIADIWTRYKWSFRRESATLTFTALSATLPTDFDLDSFYTLHHPTNSNIEYELIEEQYNDNYVNGQRKCWITGSTINIKDTDVTTLTLVYWKAAPVLSGSTDLCDLPAVLVAKGALPYVKLYDDDEFDIRILKQDYESEILSYKSQMLRSGMIDGRLVSKNERYGNYLGKVE